MQEPETIEIKQQNCKKNVGKTDGATTTQETSFVHAGEWQRRNNRLEWNANGTEALYERGVPADNAEYPV